MVRKSRFMVLVASLLVGGALLIPAAASAKTIQVKITGVANNPKDFEDVSAKLSGTFGNGSQAKCCVKLPTVNWTWTFKNSKYKGTVKGISTSKLQGTKIVGTWKFVSGAGSFKGVSGGGKIVGDITNGHYQYTGTAKLK